MKNLDNAIVNRSLMRGEANVFWPFYNYLHPYIKHQGSLLNLGSGISFAFEAYCREQNSNLEICSVDRLQPEIVPSIINRFCVADIESELDLGRHIKFDMVCLFEVIEHVDKTDVLIKNAVRYCRKGGVVALSFPNLSSLYSRLELLMGFQPHILEVSNERANLGTGIFGDFNNPTNQPIHHIRGITSRAGKELVRYHGLKIRDVIGTSCGRFHSIWRNLPGIAPVNLIICEA
ncbi:MAG: methyltransferase domain-containing protein [Proteobacteria bacterium]|nr:methyltransferase domain-containing protein [Pseudomonadota bacterium]